MTATIPAALVAEGTEVSLSLQDSSECKRRLAPRWRRLLIQRLDSQTSPETAGDAGGSTSASTSTAPEPDAAASATDDTTTCEADQGATAEAEGEADANANTDDDGADESVAEADEDTTGDDSTGDDTTDAEADAEAAADESAPATTDSATEQAPLAVAVKKVDRNQAQQTVATADAQATDRTVGSWVLLWGGGKPQAHRLCPHQHSPAGDLASAAEAIAMRSMLPRITGLALLCSMAGGPVAAQEGLPAATVQRAQEAVVRASAQPPRFQAERYNPAVLHLRFTSAEGKTTSKQAVRSSTSPDFAIRTTRCAG